MDTLESSREAGLPELTTVNDIGCRLKVTSLGTVKCHPLNPLLTLTVTRISSASLYQIRSDLTGSIQIIYTINTRE